LNAVSRRILIVKLSSLGDVVHAMPAVQDLRRAFPGVQIDWVVERGFAPLVQRCAGVQRVIPCELRRWRKAPFSAETRAAWRAFKETLQAQRYDAVIDLQGLTKSALVSRLARTNPDGKRYALGNRTDGSGYEAPTRWVADEAIVLPPHVHAVERSRLLCARALNFSLQGEPVFGLTATHALQPSGTRAVIALVHGTSRHDKEWALESWVALGQRLNQCGYSVALAHGSTAERLVSEAIAGRLTDAHVWPALSLDTLTDTMAACSGVIGVDSGLSHIAVALDLPHVQIYNFDTAWRTGVSNTRQVCVFASPQPPVDAVWEAWSGVSKGLLPS